MALSLHSAVIPSMLQILGSTRAIVDTAENWCDENGHAQAEIIGASMIEDMLPFAYQVKCCWMHSAYALDGVRKGLFTPDMSPSPDTFDGLRGKLDEATATLGDVTEDELEALADKDVLFQLGDKFKMDFVAQDFLLSFTQPNFYFHASTAYNILRMKGLPLGKRDYLGAMRLKD